jgi:hypothetical protein
MRAADYRSSRICFHVTGTAQSAASDRYQSPRRDFLSGDQGTGNPWSASIASLAPAFRNRNLTRFTEEHRDAMDEAGQIARLLELKPGMTVGDIGAGGG